MTTTHPILWAEQDLISFPKKQLQGKICLSPYVSIELGSKGAVALCGCAAWMPSVVGNIFDNTLEEILSNSNSRQVRQSIADGTYEFCNADTCGVINNDLLNTIDTIPEEVVDLVHDSSKFIMPHEISLSGDVTCNLSCPSCRTHVFKSNDDQIEQDIQLGIKLKNNLFSTPTNHAIRLHVSTSGELFASARLMSLVSSISVTDFPNLELCIQTNGLMAEKNWHRLGDMQHQVGKITVTTDAARPATYEKLRRGGHWDDIQQALKWISEKKKQNGMALHLRMVVQQSNYQEVVEFYQQSIDLGADFIEYVKLTDWDVLPNFEQHDVFSPAHPEYQQARGLLDQVKCNTGVLLFGGL